MGGVKSAALRGVQWRSGEGCGAVWLTGVDRAWFATMCRGIERYAWAMLGLANGRCKVFIGVAAIATDWQGRGDQRISPQRRCVAWPMGMKWQGSDRLGPDGFGMANGNAKAGRP